MSALTVADVRRAQPTVLEEVAGRLRREQARALEVVAVLLLARVAHLRWAGPAADAAGSRYLVLSNRLSGVVARLGASAGALDRAAPRFRLALVLLRRAGSCAAGEGAYVDEGGGVRFPPRVVSPDVVEVALRGRRESLMRAEVDALVRRSQSVAREADDTLAGVLVAASRAVTGIPSPAGVPLAPPPVLAGVMTPFATAAWWSSLTPEQRGRVRNEHPEWVGPRDGIPALDRHGANLVLLRRLEDAARARSAEVANGWNPFDQDERTAAKNRLADLQAVRDVLSRANGGQRTLLMVDGSGALLETAVAVGDVDRAEHVVTFVGGLSTNVRGDLRRYDDTFTRMRTQTGPVADVDESELAIVTWLGYPAPQNTVVGLPGLSVLSSNRAQGYAAELAAFTNGVSASRDRFVHQTVWAHSYGTVLAGFTLLSPHSIDDVVVFGSPGLPFASIEQGQLGRGGLNVLRAEYDPVASGGPAVHGVEAETVAGSTWLSTAASKDAVNTWRASSGHSQYLVAASTSERNLVAVAVARPDRTVRAGPAERTSHVSYGRVESWWAKARAVRPWALATGAPVCR